MKPPLAQRLLSKLLALLLILLVFLFLFGPKIADRVSNRVTNRPPYQASEQAKQLYETLFVVDLHGDPLLWGRNLKKRHKHGAIDVPRLIEGNVGIQSFFIVGKAPFGMNIDRTEADSDMITLLAIFQRWPA